MHQLALNVFDLKTYNKNIMETLKYCKVRKVKSIARAHADDAGIDFYIPEDLTVEQFAEKCGMIKDIVQTMSDGEYITSIEIKPGQSVLIPSGIHVKVPDGYALIYFNKSGVASKKHLHVGACVVDQNYEGECHLNLTNVGSMPIVVNAGEKIVQGILLPINYAQTEEINSLEELYADSESTRGSGGFGSTGNA